jgi:hypothetical protein
MSFSRIIVSAPLLAATAALAVLPSVASAAVTAPGAGYENCGTNSYADIVANVNLSAGALVYNDSQRSLLTIASSSRAFISALPAKKPSGKVALAAYNKAKKAEVKTTATLASSAQNRLQLLVARADEDVSDTEASREMMINQNADTASRALEYLQECNSWNAEAGYVNATRGAEDTYRTGREAADLTYINNGRTIEADFQTQSDNNLNTTLDVYQPACAKDPGYQLKPDGPDADTSPDWVSTNSTIPSSIKGKTYAQAVPLLRAAGFTGTLKQVKKTTNSGTYGKVFAAKPGIGGLAAKTATIEIWVRSNRRDVKGLPAGTVKSTGSVVLISAAAAKKPKGRPIPAPATPSSSAVANCADAALNDPRFGHDAAVERQQTQLDNQLDDAATQHEQDLQDADTNYQRTVDNAQRALSNPFAFNLPYDEAMAQLDNRTETENLRSGRQTTEDLRRVEDAALNAQEYLSSMYGTDIQLN